MSEVEYIKRHWSWKCPKCKKNNHSKWDYFEIPSIGDIIFLTCDHCKKETEMIGKMVKVKK
jgi:C4-type Zn-finger protein